MEIKVPRNWRKGQTLFNFLEWLRLKGVDGNQNNRLADTFYIPDKDMDKYIEEFNNLYNGNK